jgi:hypothetical protein
MFENKAQSALEYLMGYGWALIVIALIIGILIFVTSGATGGTACQSQGPFFIAKEWVVNSGAGGVGVTLTNVTGGNISAISAEGSGDFSGVGVPLSTGVLKNGDVAIQGFNGPPSGETFTNGRIDVNYTTEGGLTSSTYLVCTGTVS